MRKYELTFGNATCRLKTFDTSNSRFKRVRVDIAQFRHFNGSHALPWSCKHLDDLIWALLGTVRRVKEAVTASLPQSLLDSWRPTARDTEWESLSPWVHRFRGQTGNTMPLCVFFFFSRRDNAIWRTLVRLWHIEEGNECVCVNSRETPLLIMSVIMSGRSLAHIQSREITLLCTLKST